MTMRNGWLACLGLVLAVAFTAGCQKETEPGGPGANGANGEAANEKMAFDLHLPKMATNIEQGSEDTVQVELDRGDDFKQKVKLALTPPAGVTLEPSSFEFVGENNQVDIKVMVAADARTGKHKIKVTGTPETGKASEGMIEIEVNAADAADTPPAGLNDTPPAGLNDVPPAGTNDDAGGLNLDDVNELPEE